METVTKDSTCKFCRYCDRTIYIDDKCKKGIKRARSPEGVSYIVSWPDCDVSLSEFRSSNGGVCPHFKKSIVYRIAEFVAKLLGVDVCFIILKHLS